MQGSKSFTKLSFLKDQELVFLIFCTVIAASLIFWPLLNSIACFLFFGYWLFFTKKDFAFPKTKKYWIFLFCALYLAVVVSALHSGNIKVAITKLQLKSPYLLFPLIFGTSQIITQKIARQTFLALILSTVAGCIFCLIRGGYKYFQTDYTKNLYGYELVTALKDMTPFAMSLCCLLSLLLLLEDFYKFKKHSHNSAFFSFSLPYFLLSIFLLSFLFVLGNRNMLILAGGISIFYCFKIVRQLKFRLLAIATVATAFAASVTINPFLNQQWNELINFSEKNSIDLDVDNSLGRSWGGGQIRMAIWNCTADVIKNNWLLGVGVGDVQDSLQAAYEKRKFYFASRYNRYNTHNQYLQETVSGGIIQLFVFLACIIMPLFLKSKAGDRQLYRLFLFCFAFGCLTDTPLELNKGIIWYTFFNSLIFFKNYNFKYNQFNEQATAQ